jgi:hypothetical protein
MGELAKTDRLHISHYVTTICLTSYPADWDPAEFRRPQGWDQGRIRLTNAATQPPTTRIASLTP